MRKDTDYLVISTRIHTMETRLLTHDRMERMIDAKDVGEAFKVLEECGYTTPTRTNNASVEQMLSEQRLAAFQDLGSAVPDQSLVSVFRLKYDYHNAKVLVKARGSVPERLLLAGGRYDPEELLSAWTRDDLILLDSTFREALTEARNVLAETGDPQASDFILDRAYYREMGDLAAKNGSRFLRDYVRLLIDTANLRAVVRCARMERDSEFVSRVLIPNGSVSESALVAAKNEGLQELFRYGSLSAAAEEGARLIQGEGGTLVQFERLCDDAVTDYVSQAKRIPFGEQPVIGYLHAKEAELTAIRTILSGRMAGLDGDIIRSRLRTAYA